MVANIVLPIFGLFGIYHTIRTLISLVHNKFLLIRSIVFVIFLQIVSNFPIFLLIITQNILFSNTGTLYGKPRF